MGSSISLRDLLSSQHPSTQNCQPGLLTHFCVQSLGFHYVGVIDGIITQVVELNLLTPLLPEGQADITELKDPTLSLQDWLFWHGPLPP